MKTQNTKILPLALVLAVLGLNLSAIQQVKGAGFVSVSPMNNARSSHTATLLPNGKVLVAGGLDTISPGGGVRLLSSAEIYEPDPDGVTPSITILHNANQIMSFSWSGVGTLEQSDSLTTPNWQPAPIQDDPHIISTTDLMKFFRVKAD